MSYRYKPRGCPPAVGKLCVTAFDLERGKRIVEPCRDVNDAFFIRQRMELDRKLSHPRIDPLT